MVDAVNGSPTADAADRVIAAIVVTRESAAEGDHHLTSSGVTWTDPVEAAVLRDALAAHKVETVMLVSAFLAAAALAQSVGSAVGCAQTGLLFLEPDTATLAVVDSADGSITELCRQAVHGADTSAELAAMVASGDADDPLRRAATTAAAQSWRVSPAWSCSTRLSCEAPAQPGREGLRP